jgi:hypothetical protein
MMAASQAPETMTVTTPKTERSSRVRKGGKAIQAKALTQANPKTML